MSQQRVVGLLLILIGVGVLLALTTEVGGEVLPALVGVGFLTAYAFTRTYGFLVPGAILTGLGTGLLIAEAGGPGEAVIVGLGVGFLAIALLNRALDEPAGGWWWPFIPGGILVTVGSATLEPVTTLLPYLLPAALIVIGVLLVLRRPSRARGPAVDAADPDGDAASQD